VVMRLIWASQTERTLFLQTMVVVILLSLSRFIHFALLFY